ncbi:hypothetical protein L9F63_020829, partial [Diploptera punctata]
VAISLRHQLRIRTDCYVTPMITGNTFIRRFQLWKRDIKANGILICWPIIVGSSRGSLLRRNKKTYRKIL